jgi:hypothetical protein
LEKKAGAWLHMANFVSMRMTCTKCADEKRNEDISYCDICRPNPNYTTPGLPFPFFSRSKSWSMYDSDDPMSDFMDFLLEQFNKNHECIIYSHNGGRFDEHFILRELYLRKKAPEVFMHGNKIYQIQTWSKNKCKLTFR